MYATGGVVAGDIRVQPVQDKICHTQKFRALFVEKMCAAPKLDILQVERTDMIYVMFQGIKSVRAAYMIRQQITG